MKKILNPLSIPPRAARRILDARDESRQAALHWASSTRQGRRANALRWQLAARRASKTESFFADLKDDLDMELLRIRSLIIEQQTGESLMDLLP